MNDLLISFKIVSLALRQSYDCLSAIQITWKNMDKNLPVQNDNKRE